MTLAKIRQSWMFWMLSLTLCLHSELMRAEEMSVVAGKGKTEVRAAGHLSSLKDFGIDIPKHLGITIAETVVVTSSFKVAAKPEATEI